MKEVEREVIGEFHLGKTEGTPSVIIDYNPKKDYWVEDLKITEKVSVPTNLSEFLEEKGLTKSELTEWLNENYK